MNRRATGTCYEKKAAKYLTGQGYEIITMNYRCPIGEIDIVAKEGESLVFVEVKYRKDCGVGDPAQAVGYKKQKILSKVAAYYLMREYGTLDVSCRFDVVAILDEYISMIQNAFMYIG
ncbi:MAG: YraN family protein [Lachnospiraceae bacterium]|nr:YraN family protein [Lachnospiraceae bacterium]